MIVACARGIRSASSWLWIVICIGPALAAADDGAPPPVQIAAGLTLGAGGANLRTDPIPAFHLGARADALFFRKSDRGMALGPYVEVLTVAFETFEAGGGLSWLLPLGEHFPLVLSAGAHARGYWGSNVSGWEPGVHASLFFGSRSLNFSSLYGLAGGLYVEGRWGLGDGHQADLLFGAVLDFELLAMPFILLVNAFR